VEEAGSQLAVRRRSMSSDETRQILRTFGVAVTAYEDAVRSKSSVEEIRESEANVRRRLREVTTLIERLSGEAPPTGRSEAASEK
jgi:hypothetical protein